MTDIAGGYWEAVATMDADQVASRFAQQALFQFGNTPPQRGRANIRRSFVHLFTRTAQIFCRTLAVWGCETCLVSEADLAVVFDDGRALTIPITSTFRMKGSRYMSVTSSFIRSLHWSPRALALGCYGKRIIRGRNGVANSEIDTNNPRYNFWSAPLHRHAN